MAATARVEPVRWWHDGVGYEIYVRSFADADGDGIGDLPGLTERLEHLAWLGVSAIWLTPIGPSPLFDHGYDVAGYTEVAPEYGDLEDFDALVTRAHELDVKVLCDLVPNHTSAEHPWFVSARSSRDDAFREYYVWRDPAPDGGPPNNWPSHFGGPAWSFDEHTQQYWLHQFASEQPDLNWHHPAVVEEFDRILKFWFERGIDGFRIDVAHSLVTHEDLPDLPEAPSEAEMGVRSQEFERFEHIYDRHQPEVLDVYRRWRAIAEPYDAVLLGEVYELEPELMAPYLDAQDGLHLAFWFPPTHVEWDADELRDALISGMELRAGTLAWVASSHDRSRAVTRFGGGAEGRARALALSTLLFGLPGTPFLYMGEELGLEDAVIPREEAQDPVAVRGGEYERNRDVVRTPMPWSPEPGLGFTSADRAWIRFGDRSEEDTVAAQRDTPDSILHRYRRLVDLRRSLPDLHAAPLEWLTASGPLIAYRRGGVIVAANCGDEPDALDLPDGAWEATFVSADEDASGPLGKRVPLIPSRAVILTRA